MLVLGILLLILGWFLGISIVYTIGIALVIIGAVLMLIGVSTGHPFGGRYFY